MAMDEWVDWLAGWRHDVEQYQIWYENKLQRGVQHSSKLSNWPK